MLACVLTLPWTLSDRSALYFNHQDQNLARTSIAARPVAWFGFDNLGRSMLGRPV